MFLGLDEFCSAVLSRHPSVALVTWASQEALGSFVARLGSALREDRADTVLSKLACADLDSVSFGRKLVGRFGRRNVRKCCLLVYQLDPLASAAGGILNGYRERLAAFRAVVVVVRENRERDFLRACPDLMDWVGTLVTRAEDLAPPLTLRDVNSAIRRLELKSGMRTKEFQAKWSRGEVKGSDDYWFWNELIAIRDDMKSASAP